MTQHSGSIENWKQSDWFDKWQQLAKRDYHGRHGGHWRLIYNQNGELFYEYVDK